jgi:hypothetical protein
MGLTTNMHMATINELQVVARTEAPTWISCLMARDSSWEVALVVGLMTHEGIIGFPGRHKVVMGPHFKDLALLYHCNCICLHSI